MFWPFGVLSCFHVLLHLLIRWLYSMGLDFGGVSH